MLKVYIKARHLADRLLADIDGVTSLEYVAVAAAVVLVVVTVFNGTGTTSLTGILNSGFTTISNHMTPPAG